MKRSNKGKSTSKTLPNPVLEKAEQAIVQVGSSVLTEAAPGLNLVQIGERVTVPGLENFPLGVTRGGMFSGKLMNIGQFCLEQTGKAWSEGHQKTLKKQGITVSVLKPTDTMTAPDGTKVTTKDYLSRTLDSYRPNFATRLKAVASMVVSRADSEVTKFRVRRTRNGVAFDQTTVIKSESEMARLTARLNQLEKENAALKAVTPKEVMKQIHKMEAAHAPIEVKSETAPEQPPIEIPAAPAQAPEPAVK